MCQRVRHGNGTTEKVYELMQEPKTQQDAVTDCRKINGRELASICNQKEQEAFDESTTSPTTTTNGQSTTSPTTTTNGQSTTSPTTTTNGESTTPPTSTSSGQLTSSCPTSPDWNPTSSPSSTTSLLHPDYLHYVNESKSWINALEFCKSRGSKSNLVHITNQTVQADVTQLLANVELPCVGVWIGLERSIFEWSAPWLWTSGDVDKVVKYSGWHSCFPLNPINYHCGKMVRVDNGELKWLDASCHQELPFICQDLQQRAHHGSLDSLQTDTM
ncbi:macrophage mannose receptor 1-like [Oncorhynchus clarkii lewisi]|uniref:macrophage mannose receptor 1-like n=1 Tax=Oncorhynchus clarkii lewisi TaxID=490388 RepID=UPI0039B98B83